MAQAGLPSELIVHSSCSLALCDRVSISTICSRGTI